MHLKQMTLAMIGILLGAVPVNAHQDSYDQQTYRSSEIDDSCDFSVFGDFLYWKANVEGTELAEKAQVTPGAITTDDYRTVKVEGTWQPGFRVGVGYQFDKCDEWDLGLCWTYFKDKSKRVSEEVSGTEIMYPLAFGIVGPQATTAKAHWDFTTNIIDLDLGKNFHPLCNLAIKPHVGIRGAYFDFKSQQHYTGSWNFIDIDVDPGSAFQLLFPTSSKNDFNYKGIGLKLGCDTEWEFCKDFSLVAKLSASLLYGKYQIHQYFNGQSPDVLADGFPLVLPTQASFHKDMWRLRSDIEAFLGLKWETYFNCDQCKLSLMVGYDIAQWFQLNECFQIVDELDVHNALNAEGVPFVSSQYYIFENLDHGNVALQGLTVRAYIDF